MSALRNTPALRFFKTTLALGLDHGSEHRVSLLIGFTTSERTVEVVSARITSFVDPHGIEVPTWLMSMIEGDKALTARLLSEMQTARREAA